MAPSAGIVVLHYGPMNPQDMLKASEFIGKDAKMDTVAARMAGASFAFGTSEALDAMKQQLVAMNKAQISDDNPDLSPQAITWLASGERGMSSEAIFMQTTGVALNKNDGTSHPYDPDDLRRCRLLLEAVPETAAAFSTMANISPQWAALVEIWGDLCAQMDAESPEWRAGKGEAPKTYARMRALWIKD